MAALPPLTLTASECQFLGATDESLQRNTRFRVRELILPDVDECYLLGFASGFSYDLTIENGYQRTRSLGNETYGPIKHRTVHLHADGNGFHPTLCASHGIFVFLRPQIESDIIASLHARGLEPWIDVKFPNAKTVVISAKYPATDLIVFNIFPHNCGIDIKIITS